MHLVVGFINLILAQILAGVFRSLRIDFFGRRVIRLCCATFTAGAGLDDAAIEVIRGLGQDGIRLLTDESERKSQFSRLAALMLKMLRH